MYSTPNPNVDKYKQMEHMIIVLLPSYISDTSDTHKAAEVIREFGDMEQARATIVGVEDTAVAVTEYLDHHFYDEPKPQWYANLT